MGNSRRGPVPVALFSIAVGSQALAGAWRVGERIWSLPGSVVTVLTLGSLAIWLTLIAAYAHKWLAHRDEALAELRHPFHSLFAALVPVSTLLAAQGVYGYSHQAAITLFVIAVVAQLGLGVFVHGRLWQGGINPELMTPAMYLPTVAQNFVTGATAALFGWSHVGAMFFGAGAISWLVIESMLLHRAAVRDALPEALRPILGIQLAPPVVGGVAYLSLTSGTPDLVAQVLLGYGLYQGLVLLRLLPWIRKQAFAPSYWAFSFGVAALPTMAMRMVERGATGPLEWLAPALFVIGNVIIGILLVKTAALIAQGRLLPATAPKTAPAARAATRAVTSSSR